MTRKTAIAYADGRDITTKTELRRAVAAQSKGGPRITLLSVQMGDRGAEVSPTLVGGHPTGVTVVVRSTKPAEIWREVGEVWPLAEGGWEVR